MAYEAVHISCFGQNLWHIGQLTVLFRDAAHGIYGNVASLVLTMHIPHGAYLYCGSWHIRQQHGSGSQPVASSRVVVEVYLCLVRA